MSLWSFVSNTVGVFLCVAQRPGFPIICRTFPVSFPYKLKLRGGTIGLYKCPYQAQTDGDYHPYV